MPDLIEPSPDCDGDGVSDWCQIVEDPLLDCDGNGVLDLCEIGLPGGEADCDGNGVLDRCQPEFQLGGGASDCDGNGVADALDICRDPGLDCNRDGVLDSCQWQGGEGDCDGNGVPDACEIGDDPTRDCDGNGVLDICEHGGCGIGFEDGPLYLGDGDWGRWGFVLPPDCGQPKFSVDYGPVEFWYCDGQYAYFQALQLLPSDDAREAQLRIEAECNGCRCVQTVKVTVQPYSGIHVEARAFIPCEVVTLSFLGTELGQFEGDCRSFSCASPTLGTSVSNPSSRVVAGASFSLRFQPGPVGWWAPYTSVHASKRVTMSMPAHASQYNSCGGASVAEAVGSDGSRCDWLALATDPPCLPVGVNPNPTVADLSTCPCLAPGVGFVGAPRYKRVDVVLAAPNSCLVAFGQNYAADINLEVEVRLWQRCDPTEGMQPARVDFSGEHDAFPAYELVIQEETTGGGLERGCLYTCPAVGDPASLIGLNRVTFGPPPSFQNHAITSCPQLTPTASFWRPVSFYLD